MMEVPNRREQLREERRRQILEAALAVFGQKGFHAANVSDVAAQAGVSQGTIYWYFESKDELLTAALVSMVEDLAGATLAGLEEDMAASDKLRVLAAAMEQLGDAGNRLFTMFLEFWASSPRREEAAQVWLEVLIDYKEVLVNIVEEGIRNGEFKAVDAEGVVWAVMAAYDGLAAYATLMPELDLGSISRTFMEALLQGLQVDGLKEGKEAAA